jgi:hypothetical protein
MSSHKINPTRCPANNNQQNHLIKPYYSPITHNSDKMGTLWLIKCNNSPRQSYNRLDPGHIGNTKDLRLE